MFADVYGHAIFCFEVGQQWETPSKADVWHWPGLYSDGNGAVLFLVPW